jgi:hypothetical protein
MLSLTYPKRKHSPHSILVAVLTSCRYIAVTMRFLTDELAFENESECRAFLESHGALHIIDDTSGRVKVKEGSSIFERLRSSAFSKVDIKGQI